MAKNRQQIIDRLLQAGIPQAAIDARFAELTDDAAVEREYGNVEFAVILRQFTDQQSHVETTQQSDDAGNDTETEVVSVQLTREDISQIVSDAIAQALQTVTFQLEEHESDSNIETIVREQGTVIGSLNASISSLNEKISALSAMFARPDGANPPRSSVIRVAALQKHVTDAKNVNAGAADGGKKSVFDIAKEDRTGVVKDQTGTEYDSVTSMLFGNN